MWNSPIVRMTTGLINTVNDSVIGGSAGISGASKFAGQLGSPIWMDDGVLFFDSSVGTVYGGRFRYVRLSAAASAVVRGQLVFWDISVADNLFQVTTVESGSVPGAQLRAGVVLNPSWTPGNYGFIQDVGPTYVKFRAALTAVPAGVGVSVYAAAAGAGADNGLADVINSADPTTFADVGLLQNRYLGSAIELPTNAGVKLVNLNLMSVRG